jgi:3-phosphoglycerate kinase
MNNLRRENVKGKRVLVRCDLNVPFDEKGNIGDDFRIRVVAPTISYLRDNGAKIIVISHLGQPKSRDERFTLKPEAKRLWEIIGGRVKFLNEIIGKKVEEEVKRMQEGDVLVLENLRFNKGETENDPKFAAALASLADIFVQDGFGVCHREHASVVGVPKLLPSFAGFALEKEIKVLSDVLVNPERPLVSIIGGVKISTKAKVIERLLDKSDQLLMGGKIANSLLVAKGLCIKDSLSQDDEDLADAVKGIDLNNTKLHLPVDGVMALANFEEEYSRIGAVGTLRREEGIFDIGPETVEKFRMILNEAKTVIWNGPLGFFERPEFSKGTLEVAKIIALNNDKVFSVVGGGETVEAIHQLNMESNFDHISCGGGAMLDFLAGKDLPGINALEQHKKEADGED